VNTTPDRFSPPAQDERSRKNGIARAPGPPYDRAPASERQRAAATDELFPATVARGVRGFERHPGEQDLGGTGQIVVRNVKAGLSCRKIAISGPAPIRRHLEEASGPLAAISPERRAEEPWVYRGVLT